MLIPKINTNDTSSMSDLADLLKNSNLPEYQIDKINWPETYPYKPEVSLKVAHNGTELLIQYHVKEAYTLAKVGKDNGEVWTDSCCECFVSFDDSGYYNLEVTCIGKALLSFRLDRDNATPASEAILKNIRRHSSLGTDNFEERKGDNDWYLTLAIPATSFFKHHIKSFDKMTAKMNFYKCGDNLTVPHFASLFPIVNDKPNFHLPQFFQKIKFE